MQLWCSRCSMQSSARSTPTSGNDTSMCRAVAAHRSAHCSATFFHHPDNPARLWAAAVQVTRSREKLLYERCFKSSLVAFSRRPRYVCWPLPTWYAPPASAGIPRRHSSAAALMTPTFGLRWCETPLTLYLHIILGCLLPLCKVPHWCYHFYLLPCPEQHTHHWR